MPQVRVICKPDGKVVVDAQGFKGGSCDQATTFLSELFGAQEKKDYKPEYWEAEKEVVCEGLPSGYCG